MRFWRQFERLDQGALYEEFPFEADRDLSTYALVVTPRCDIDHRLAYVTLLPATPAFEFLEEQIQVSKIFPSVTVRQLWGKDLISKSKLKPFMKELGNRLMTWHPAVPRYHFLPDYDSVPPCFVDFQAAHSCSKEFLESCRGVGTIASPYIEHLVARYAAWQGRVGVEPFTEDEIETIVESITHFRTE